MVSTRAGFFGQQPLPQKRDLRMTGVSHAARTSLCAGQYLATSFNSHTTEKQIHHIILAQANDVGRGRC